VITNHEHFFFDGVISQYSIVSRRAALCRPLSVLCGSAALTKSPQLLQD